MEVIGEYQLRLLTRKDSLSFFTLINKNRDRLEDFFAGTIAQNKTLDQTKAYCHEIQRKIKSKAYYPYLVINSVSNQAIGLVDVKNIDWNIPKGELGAFIDEEYERKGLITRLTTHLINQIVEEHKFKKLLCRAAQQNTRSINVIKNIGFDLEGTIRRDYKPPKEK